MRLLILNHIQNASQSLHSSRIRSSLTMLGVTIGIASITTIMALSSGASQIVGNQVNSLGGNIAVIRPGESTNLVENFTKIQTQNKYAISSLTEKDLLSINDIQNVKLVVPLMTLSGNIKADSTSSNNSVIVATTPDLAELANLKTSEGQFLDEEVNVNTAVLGTQLSIDIFGTEFSIGRTFSIKGKQFTVIGVLKRQNNPINYNSVDFDNAVIINFSSGKELNQNVSQIQQINIKADSISNLDNVIININKTLLKNHDGENDFLILTGNQISQPTSQFFYTIAGAMTAIATISLIVGGIGIMNIMLVTVAERTREIGIRKALGASDMDISMQFLIESLVISICGGITGYLLGYLLAFGICTFLTFEPSINWQIAIIAILISVIMGLLFGLYPAIRAARKDPIQSLHSYD
ncbi:MAG TPA: ABC transporter permease [Candidatus Saccharibacteria bacterium]|nr:ABC transporter permease [Candidatus Saccharibacteria bacterium]